MKLNDNKEILNFLDAILAQVKFRDAHPEIIAEYTSHIKESSSAAQSYGLNQHDALKDAIRRLGNPVEIGTHLDHIHKPKLDILIALTTIVLCIIGIYSLSSLGYSGNQAGWMFLGFGACAAALFVRPQHFIKYAPALYGTAVVMLTLAHFSGVVYDGQPYLSLGSLPIKVVDFSTGLFLISITGLLYRPSRKTNRGQVLVLGLAIIPLFYYCWLGSIFPALIYFASILTIFVSARSAGKWIVLFTTLGLVSLAISVKTGAFISPEKFKSLQVTESHTDFIFYHLANVTPALAILCILFFGLLLTRVLLISDEIKNPMASSLTKTILVFITTSTVWSVVSGLGYFPIPQTGVNLPFISYGGTPLVLHLAMVGIVLGLARRKTIHFN